MRVIYSVQNKEGIYCSKKRIVHVVKEFEKNSHGIPVFNVSLCLYSR